MKKKKSALRFAIAIFLIIFAISCSTTDKAVSSEKNTQVQETQDISQEPVTVSSTSSVMDSQEEEGKEVIAEPQVETKPEPKAEPVSESKPEPELYKLTSVDADSIKGEILGYPVTLNINGGILPDNVLDSYMTIVASGATSIPLPDMTKEGFTDLVWKDEKGNVVTELNLTKLSSAVTFTAEWTEIVDSIEEPPEEEVVVEEVIEEPIEDTIEEVIEEPVKEVSGNTFEAPFEFVTAYKDFVKIKIKLKDKEFFINLYTDGGVFKKDIEKDYYSIIFTNPTSVPLPILEKDGYEAFTWKDAENKVVTEVDITALTSDVTFYAERGELVKYPLDYDEIGVLYEPAPVEEVPVEEVITEPDPVIKEEEKKPENPHSYTIEDAFILINPERTGYEFVGWILDNQKSYEAKLPGEITLGSSGAKNFIGVWNPCTSNITYTLNGGHFQKLQRNYFIQDEEPFTIENPEKANYIFVGWSVNGDDEKVVKDYTVDTSVYSDISLEAIWIPVNFTLTYDEEGVLFEEKPEEVVVEEKKEEIVLKNPVTYTVEDEFDLINPTKYGYKFCGWIENGEPSYMARPIYSIIKGTSGDKDFVTVWSPLTISISYELNGGKAENRTSYTFAESAFTLNQPVKEHYVFEGWKSNRDAKLIKDYTVDTNKSENLTLEAIWTPVEYSIVYNLEGGEFPEYPENPTSFTVEDETFTILNPTKEGYEFMGWEVAIVEPSYGPLYTLDLSNNDSVFKFEIYPEFTLFQFSKDTLVGDNIELLLQEIKEEYPKLTSTWKYERSLDGIKISYPEGNAEYVKAYIAELQASFMNITIAKGSYGERVLTAIWEPIVYQITYDQTGVVYTVAPEEVPTNPTSYTIEDEFTIINPEKTGYHFLGWILEGEPETMARSIYEIKLGSTGDLNLVPVWEKVVSNITYIMNGGELPENAPSTFEYGDNSIRLKTPTRENYNFVGWKDSEDASPVWSYTIDRTLDKDLTLEAVWEPTKYFISYDLNGGSKVEEVTYESYYTIIDKDFCVNAPARDYYVFKGWKEYGQYDSKANVNFLVKTEEARNLYLVAVWEPITYTITYVNDGQYKYEIENPTSYTVESEDLYIAKPYKDGYDFLGWVVAGDRTETLNNPMVIKTGSHGDLKLYAEYAYSNVPVGKVTELQYQIVVYGKNGIIRPDWVIKVPESSTEHYEKGYAKCSTFYESYLEAIKSAKTSYAYWILTNVELTDKNINGVAYDSKAFSESTSLTNVEVVEYWEDAEGGVWVLIK